MMIDDHRAVDGDDDDHDDDDGGGGHKQLKIRLT